MRGIPPENRKAKILAKRSKIINAILCFCTPLSSYLLYENSAKFTKIPLYLNSLTLAGVTPLAMYCILSFATKRENTDRNPDLKKITQTCSLIANHVVLAYAASSALPTEEYQSTAGTFLSYGALASSIFLDRVTTCRYINAMHEENNLKQDLAGLFVMMLASGVFASVHIGAEKACIALLPELKEYGIGSICGVGASAVLLQIVNKLIPGNLDQER